MERTHHCRILDGDFGRLDDGVPENVLCRPIGRADLGGTLDIRIAGELAQAGGTTVEDGRSGLGESEVSLWCGSLVPATHGFRERDGDDDGGEASDPQQLPHAPSPAVIGRLRQRLAVPVNVGRGPTR